MRILIYSDVLAFIYNEISKRIYKTAVSLGLLAKTLFFLSFDSECSNPLPSCISTCRKNRMRHISLFEDEMKWNVFSRGQCFIKKSTQIALSPSHDSSLQKHNGGAAAETVGENCLNPIFRNSPWTSLQKLDLRHRLETDILQQTNWVYLHVTNGFQCWQKQVLKGVFYFGLRCCKYHTCKNLVIVTTWVNC